MPTLQRRLEIIRDNCANRIDFRSSTWRDWDLVVDRHATETKGGLHVQARKKEFLHMMIVRDGGRYLWAYYQSERQKKLDLFLWMEEHIKGAYTIRSMVVDSETTPAKRGDAIFFFKNIDDAEAFEVFCDTIALDVEPALAPSE